MSTNSTNGDGKSSTPLQHFAVLLILTIITLLMTYPLVFELSEKVPGDFDVYQYLWNFWHYKKSVLSGDNPFFAPELFYPTGVPLYLSTTTPLLSTLSIPFQDSFGRIVLFNVFYILSFILSGYFMYLLAKYLTRDSWASFIAALVFAFFPHHTAQAFLGQINLMSIQFLPLFLLFHIQLKESPTVKHMALLSTALALVGYTEILYFGLCILFLMFDFIYDHLFYKKQINLIQMRGLFFSVFIAALLLSPYLVGLIHQLVFIPYFPYSDIFFTHLFSADLLSFFIPSPLNPFLSPLFQSIYPLYKNYGLFTNYLGQVKFVYHFTESIVYMGISILFLSIYARIKLKTYEIKKWFDLLLLSAVFSLGPFLTIASQTIPFLLPYFFASLIPSFSMFRVPSRFDVLVMLAAAILTAFGYLELRRSLNPKSFIYRLFPSMLLAIILFEFWAIPVHTQLNLSVSSFYYTLAQDTGTYAVFDVPQETPPDFSEYSTYLLFTQTVHRKKLVGGAISRFPIYVSEFTNQSCIKNLATLSFSNSCTNQEYNSQLGNEIRYILYHQIYPEELIHNQTLALAKLEELFGAPVFEDEELVVYCRFNCVNFSRVVIS